MWIASLLVAFLGVSTAKEFLFNPDGDDTIGLWGEADNWDGDEIPCGPGATALIGSGDALIADDKDWFIEELLMSEDTELLFGYGSELQLLPPGSEVPAEGACTTSTTTFTTQTAKSTDSECEGSDGPLGIGISLGLSIVLGLASLFYFKAKVNNDVGTAAKPQVKKDKKEHRPSALYEYANRNLSVLENQDIERDEYAWEELFESITEGTDQSTEMGSDPEHRHFNRYKNILPYDRTCVKIEPSEHTEGSSYINASYLPGHLSDKDFIATQGPVEASFNSFWQMVWEQESKAIVMLTSEIEGTKRKCHRYWPTEEDSTRTYGDITVTLVDSLEKDECINSRLRLQQEEGAVRHVTHFQYTAWPDHGVPGDASQLIEFVKSVRLIQRLGEKPLIIHCSAGCGRTGVFAVVDTMMHRAEAQDNNLDVVALVRTLRMARTGIIQTPEQLAFSHQATLTVVKNIQAREAPPLSDPNPDEHDDSTIEDKEKNAEAYVPSHGPFFCALCVGIRTLCCVSDWLVFFLSSNSDAYDCDFDSSGDALRVVFAIFAIIATINLIWLVVELTRRLQRPSASKLALTIPTGLDAIPMIILTLIFLAKVTSDMDLIAVVCLIANILWLVLTICLFVGSGSVEANDHSAEHKFTSVANPVYDGGDKPFDPAYADLTPTDLGTETHGSSDYYEANTIGDGTQSYDELPDSCSRRGSGGYIDVSDSVDDTNLDEAGKSEKDNVDNGTYGFDKDGPAGSDDGSQSESKNEANGTETQQNVSGDESVEGNNEHTNGDVEENTEAYNGFDDQ